MPGAGIHLGRTTRRHFLMCISFPVRQIHLSSKPRRNCYNCFNLLLSAVYGYIDIYSCLSKLYSPSPVAMNEESKNGRISPPLLQSLVTRNGCSFFSDGCCNISSTLIIYPECASYCQILYHILPLFMLPC